MKKTRRMILVAKGAGRSPRDTLAGEYQRRLFAAKVAGSLCFGKRTMGPGSLRRAGGCTLFILFVIAKAAPWASTRHLSLDTCSEAPASAAAWQQEPPPRPHRLLACRHSHMRCTVRVLLCMPSWSGAARGEETWIQALRTSFHGVRHQKFQGRRAVCTWPRILAGGLSTIASTICCSVEECAGGFAPRPGTRAEMARGVGSEWELPQEATAQMA